MRRTLALVGMAVVVAAAPASAESRKGSFGVDGLLAPTGGFGVVYYLTDSVSVRPNFGLGWSEYAGFHGSIGGQVRYELGSRKRFSPYLSATARFAHYGSSTVAYNAAVPGATVLPTKPSNNLGLFGSGVGGRYALSESFAVFGEGRYMYTSSSAPGRSTGWTSYETGDRGRLEGVVGVTYLIPIRKRP